MALKLDIPEANWVRLLQERIPKLASNSPILPCHTEPILTATPCPYLTVDKEGKVVADKKLLMTKMAEIMVLDRNGELPAVLWSNDETRKAERYGAEEVLRKFGKETLANLLLGEPTWDKFDGPPWDVEICGVRGDAATFDENYLLDVGQFNEASVRNLEEMAKQRMKDANENSIVWTMAGLAEEVAIVTQCESTKFKDGKGKEGRAYGALILDLAKAATECMRRRT
ncbi:hypothetical protein B0T20DRAFT_421137 [Sordaria brevicollis]|uniref:Uncharacterized protein n=1 Tax=Sordaria brevicollis TaxID=83679 RepID=A0AAE0U672_SORBR|nr:hypothetical protein B0T20DRAFT_421137 [Sordaria brevicollis]